MSTLLDVKNLGISFGGLRAVNDFDLKIQKEELYGLIGPNGAGKTTVFNLLTGVYKPDSGKVLLDGKDLTGKKNNEIAIQGNGEMEVNRLSVGKLFVPENEEFIINGGNA